MDRYAILLKKPPKPKQSNLPKYFYDCTIEIDNKIYDGSIQNWLMTRFPTGIGVVTTSVNIIINSTVNVLLFGQYDLCYNNKRFLLFVHDVRNIFTPTSDTNLAPEYIMIEGVATEVL